MRCLHGFQKDEKGAFLVFFGMALAVLLGMVALSFDLGRVANTQSELQSFADSVALAAAAELDGKSDAITRAQSAASNLISDSQIFGQDNQPVVTANDRLLDIADVTLTFLSALPADDQIPTTATTTDPTQARYIRVDLTPHEVRMNFGSALSVLTGGERSDAQVGATAVAGMTQVACAVTPLMFCLPEPGYRADANTGELIVLRSSRQGAAWQPGNFGFLDPTTSAAPDPNGPCGGRLGGRELYSCLVGAAGPVTQCYTMSSVNTQPGQRVGIAEAFNVRFDLYSATMGGERNHPDYAPAPNVIHGGANIRKGGGGGTCEYTDTRPTASRAVSADQQSMGLPRDDCMTTGTCGRVGDGVWAEGRRQYMEWNYGDRNVATVEADPFPTARTRYEVYLQEIARSGRILTSPRLETGRAQCHATPSSDPSRRILIAAGVDCTAHPFTGRGTNIPVEEFFKLFITEPATQADSETPPNIDIVVEVVGSAGGAGSTASGIFHDVVQLYR